MEYGHQYDEILKHFGEGQLKDAGAIQKDLQLENVNIISYYTDKYALWLDFRTMDDNRLHSSGRRLENTSEGIRSQITKEARSAGKLSCYLYIFQDSQITLLFIIPRTVLLSSIQPEAETLNFSTHALPRNH